MKGITIQLGTRGNALNVERLAEGGGGGVAGI